MTRREELTKSDAEARRGAQSIFDRPVVVEAGAGTGKTAILVARMLSWTLGPGWERAKRDIATYRKETRQDNEPVSDETVAARTLEGVVAITFTEAAAAEMASRLAERLARVATGDASWPGFDPALIPETPNDATLAQRARALLGQLDRLTATTIHAFCHALLRRHPLEARLHPDFTIDARGDRTEELVHGVVERAIKRAYLEAGSEEAEAEDSAASPLLEMAAYGKSPQAVAAAVTALALEGVASAGLASDPFDDEAVERLVRDLLLDFERLLEVAAGDLSHIKRATNPARLEKAVESSAAALRRVLANGVSGLAAAQSVCEALRTIWSDSGWKHFKEWNKGKFLKGEQAAFEERQEELEALAKKLVPRISHLKAARPALLDAARRAVLPLLEEVERDARSNGVVTFQALLREAWQLLSKYPRILDRERRAIRQLLVDEFQDTDQLQCDIVEFLALPESTARAGVAERDLPGLFIVGDPKQSIYGWRNADLEAYDRLVGLALGAGGERYTLVRNFRSSEQVLEEVERAIAPVMVEAEGLQPPFEPLVASGTPAKADGDPAATAAVEYWISWHPRWMAKTRQAEAAEIEARAIAEDIRKLHVSGTPWKDCALLMRNAGQIDIYLDGFRDAGVPFTVTSDKQYFRRREVIDASALIRCIVSPADHLALLTWLRSPIVGVPDAALIPLWSRSFPSLLTELDGRDPDTTQSRIDSLIEVVEQAVAATPKVPGIERIEGWDRLLTHALRNLATLRRSFTEETSDRFMERLRWAFLNEATEGARYLGRYRVSNVERLFRSVETILETRRGDVQAMLRALRRSVSMALDAEEALPQDAAENAVQVMTIHKAKGLEFGHVYLAQLHAQGRHSERNEFDADRRWDGTGQLEYSLFNVATLGFDAVEKRRERVSAAEQVRTLYVAMTRAKRRLVLVGNWREASKRPPRGQPTYVQLLSRRRGQPESIAELARTAGALPEGVVDAAGVRWRFPGLHPPSARVSVAEKSPLLPSSEAVEASSKTLLRSRDQAQRHMERRFLARASLGEDHEAELDTDATAKQPRPYSRAAALAIGKAVHSALECWDFEVDPSNEAQLHRARADRYLEGLLADSDLDAASQEIGEIFERLLEGELLERLRANAGRIAARELPILIPPTQPDDGDQPRPVAGTSGTVDLVLGDSASTWTVIDYKTDRVESDEEMSARAKIYGPQLATYAQAVGESLGLSERPATEIWFLWPDRVWPLS